MPPSCCTTACDVKGLGRSDILMLGASILISISLHFEHMLVLKWRKITLKALLRP